MRTSAGLLAETFNAASPSRAGQARSSGSDILDDMGMTGTAASEFGNTGSDQTQVEVTAVGSTHPLGAGFPVGNVTTSTAVVSHGWGKPAAGAIIAAAVPSDATKATIFGYDTGATMSTGTAPARRVAWFHCGGAGTLLNDNATAFFDAAVTWAATTTPVVRYTRDAGDRIVERKVNTRTVARYSYTASGDTSDLTLDGANNLALRGDRCSDAGPRCTSTLSPRNQRK